jgi:uncharacterized protein (DUF1697 family)
LRHASSAQGWTARYLVLLRGINVGGRNKVPMAALRDLLESHGHTNVSSHIASGNVILSSDRSGAAIKRELEQALPKTFKSATAMKVFDPRPGVDEVWPGNGVIDSQRLSAQRTKSRLGKIVGTPAYKSMTIRSWATTMALLERMEAPEPDA